MKRLATLASHSPRVVEKRLLSVITIALLLLGGVFVRLTQLQIAEHQAYQNLANENKQSLVPLAPKRGMILDRHGHPLAFDRPVSALFLDRRQTSDPQAALSQLATWLAIPPPTAQKLLQHYQLRRRTRLFPVLWQLSPRQLATLAVHHYQLPGMVVKTEPVRTYDPGPALLPALGYLGRLNSQELADVDHSNYINTHLMGKAGLERTYEPLLHGTTGFQYYEVNANGDKLKQTHIKPPTPGATLTLTLDKDLEKAAYLAFANHAGAAVAIEPSSGDILALVSAPSADPNTLSQGHIPQGKQPLFNRALRGQYPPASTIKPLLALAALNKHVITPTTAIDDPGWFKLPHSQHVFHDWLRTGHGRISLHRAIVTSCDTFFYHLALNLGIDAIDAILSDFGYGQALAADLPNQASGILASPTEKLIRHHQRWYLGDTIISGIGQGDMLTTPLQLAGAAATLATQGELYQPHLIKAITSAHGITTTVVPKRIKQVVIRPKHWHQVIRAMHDVIVKGTGYRFGTPPYSAAGKTGTAQLVHSHGQDDSSLPENLRDHSLFIGFAPLKSPKIAVAVVVEHAPDAPAVARRIMDAYLKRTHG